MAENEVDIDDYTRHEAYKTLLAIEEHVANFSDKPNFCTSCIKKHCAYLEILADECYPAQCKLNPVYKEIKSWAIKTVKEINNNVVDEKMILDIASTAREYRKKLETENKTRRHLS